MSNPMQNYNFGCQDSSSRSITSIQFFASRISHGEHFLKIHWFCCLTLKFFMRQNLIQTSSYSSGWIPPCDAMRTYKPSSFLTICATSLPTTHFSHTKKKTFQDETNHIIQTKLSYNWKLNVEVPFTTMFFSFHFCKLYPIFMHVDHFFSLLKTGNTGTLKNILQQTEIEHFHRLTNFHWCHLCNWWVAIIYLQWFSRYPLLNQWLLVWNFGIWNRISSWYGIIYLKSTLTQPIWTWFTSKPCWFPTFQSNHHLNSLMQLMHIS